MAIVFFGAGFGCWDFREEGEGGGGRRRKEEKRKKKVGLETDE